MSKTKVCKSCAIEKPISEYYTAGRGVRRGSCKACECKRRRKTFSPEELAVMEFEKNNKTFKLCKRLSYDAYARVFAPSRSHKRCYRELKIPYGFETPKDMAYFLYDNFRRDIEGLLDKGKTPSVDRIDSTLGYIPENIRVIDFKENTLRGVERRKRRVTAISPSGDTRTYESVTACARAFDTAVCVIRLWLRQKHKPKNGYQFVYAN